MRFIIFKKCIISPVSKGMKLQIQNVSVIWVETGNVLNINSMAAWFIFSANFFWSSTYRNSICGLLVILSAMK